MLVVAGLGRALTLVLIPLCWWLGVLQVWLLALLLVLFGSFAVFGFAASQSFLPQLVDRSRLVGANARLDQADNAAATLGPTLGGALVGLLGAPVALLVDAVSYLAEGALNASIKVPPPPRASGTRRLRREIADGWRATYHHRRRRGRAQQPGRAGGDPDALLGRVNAFIRSANRSMGALGAVLGGAAVGLVGTGASLVTEVVLLTAAAAVAALSPVRDARIS